MTGRHFRLHGPVLCRKGGAADTPFLPRAHCCKESSVFHLIYPPSLICSSHTKSLCGQIARIHLVHFWVHHMGPSLRGTWFLQGNVNQWPVFLSGVRWWCEWGNDLPFLVSLNNNNKLKNNRICFWSASQASRRTEPHPEVWSLQHTLCRGIHPMSSD